MEINPVGGIHAVPTPKLHKKDPKVLAVLGVENAFGPQQDTFSNDGQRMTGGQDDEPSEPESAAAVDEPSNSTVDLFA